MPVTFYMRPLPGRVCAACSAEKPYITIYIDGHKYYFCSNACVAAGPAK